MITITVTDPSLADAEILRAIADVVSPSKSVKQHVSVGGTHMTNEEVRKEVSAMLTREKQAVMVTPGPRIAPEDNPAAGTDVLTTEKPIDAAAVFGAGAPALPGTEVATLPNVASPNPIPIPPPLQPDSSQTSTLPSTGETAISPPPPPPPALEQANASAAATSTNGVQLDKTGLPWDARIHASTQAVIADGTWKKRRGVEPATVVEVERQLRAAMAVPAPAAGAVQPASAWPFPDRSPHAAPPPPPPPAATERTFAALIEFITARVEAKTLVQDQVTAAVNQAGLEKLSLLVARPDLVSTVWDTLAAIAP